MKSKIINILIGMGIMGVLVGCGQTIQSVKASENSYLKYCGSKERIYKNTSVAVYEDLEHNNTVYVTTNSNSHDVSTSVVPMH